jgi:hypothetical protein
MSSNMQWYMQALKAQIFHLPIVMISLAAIVIALVKWRQAPSAALFCLLGFGIIFCLSTVMPMLQFFLIAGPGRSASGGVNAWVSAISVVWSLMAAVAYVLLAMAIFAGRSKPSEG